MKKRSAADITPGQILEQEFLKPMGITQYRLARDIGVPPRRINEIAKGRRALFLPTTLVAGLSLLLTSQLSAQTFTVLHRFPSTSGPRSTNSDGANPAGGMISSGNVLYWTATYGGSSGVGSIFSVSTAGTGFKNLHSFTAISGPLSTNSDGAYPVAALVLSGNTLYGTTSDGGNSGAGTVFKINTDGTGLKTLHHFTATSGILFANNDGAYPQAGLVLSGNILYGTARDGGTSGNGVVFALNTDGTGFANLHSFSAAYLHSSGFYTNSDGANPFGGLIISSNTLYGTVIYGGRSGQGSVFAVKTDSTGFTSLHHFTAVTLNGSGYYINSDGANPLATLALSGTTLYGTAQGGGNFGQGTAFALKTDGKTFTRLHSFNAAADGANPVAGLILSGGTLYGAAAYGGPFGSGTLFSVNTNGNGFTNLYSFTALSSSTNSEGANPFGGLFLSGNVLYGTAHYGSPAGYGTVFSFSLEAPSLAIVSSGANVILKWPASAAGFSLQLTTTFNSPGGWNNSSIVPVIVNGLNTVTNLRSGTQTFYRLSR